VDNLPPTPEGISSAIELAVMTGDLAELTTEQRSEYYAAVCRSLGLNALTKPFEYLPLNGKLRLYALRDCTDQLLRIHGISIYITNRERLGDIYIVTARAKDRTGREDESTGAVALGNLKGDALANALMKAETKSKRRVTLSIAGLGWLDGTELDTIPAAKTGNPAECSAAAENSRPSEPVTPHPLPAGEGPSHGPTEVHPTAEEISTLVDSARSANVSNDDFAHDMRRLMQLPHGQGITKKFLRETMTMSQYNTARAHYGEALHRILEENVPDHGTPRENLNADASRAASVPTDEPNATEAGLDAAKAKLRAEATSWGIAAGEIDHILTHHPLAAARNIVWKARRQASATLTAAAD
jgi:hypothetical protein